jgi:hypothetical protein
MNFTILQADPAFYSDFWTEAFNVFVIILFSICIYAFVKGGRMLKTVLSHWHHPFESVPFSAQEFYSSVEAIMKTKDINLATSRINYAQGGMLSPNREYLRIQYEEFVYDICAAPFGKRYFVSWWLGETGNPVRDFFVNLPVVGKLFTRRKKTFFELDTEIMFKETVSLCVREAIEQLTQDKGVRKLADADWKEYSRPY